MAQCPVCASEVPEDFGLIECAQCKTPLLVQMDGSVQSMETSDQGVEPQVEMIQENGDADFADMLVGEAQEDPIPEEDVTADENLLMDAPIVGMDAKPELPPPLPESESEPEPVQDVDAFFDEPAAPVSPEAMSDLSQLANNTDTDAQSGAIRYNVSVAGIDTAEIRKEFRDLISDRRFLWDVDGILKSVRSGRVKMENITAVKAILLIHRLRGLPVHVQWEQHVVHQG